MLRKATLTLAAFATLVLATPSLAQSICGERSRFLDQLSERYGENPAAIGLVSNGSLLEVLTSKQGSWTIIVTKPSGVSCVLASGESWESVPTLAMGPSA
ncbi:MAG: hypothetical protein QF893_17670 [Alphaproteobacteria bacterium]|jgi:6-phosphogluconate dehydrogenase|nr:hypothetical protein [Alphaproteobacteria bacterium]